MKRVIQWRIDKLSRLILVTGATRSGKSSFAEGQANKLEKPVAYLATAQALDYEMQERIKLHRMRRPCAWKTFEEPYQIEEIIAQHHMHYPIWILDCITLYVSNLLFAKLDNVEADNLVANHIHEEILQRIEDIIRVIKSTNITLFAVTNEIGWGIVPPDPISRLYRDIIGRVNQRLAKVADEVYIVAVGIPLKIKPSLINENME
ncbi:MAG: bifunctional adenosylcobinamide kinase/adenosylcobinamide-phosphate guanylyltransferase [Firmicutes bacterium HGW-Firmicutes-12]|jgi:adenosylcobinamide kinase/adenosylcobinamide-phosphate guanylyltransferase|nr:MAG: bifunctional adenosylcobinamide kinase/adenosylcobinamide-phosphate guanylyltransferase [Firmicutes bacterium HGW-Firmicutes-12]